MKSAEQPLENSLENPLEDSLEVEFSILPWNGGKVAKRDCVKYFDYDKMKYKPCLRTRESGDYFIMDKEGHHKSLARYFIDAKVPSADKRKAGFAGRWIPISRGSWEDGSVSFTR